MSRAVPGAQSPVDALVKHVKNPALYNFTTNGVSLPEQAHPLLKRAPAQPPATAHLKSASGLCGRRPVTSAHMHKRCATCSHAYISCAMQGSPLLAAPTCACRH
jgi:hypothetical protein